MSQDRELARAAADLSETLESLREELREPPRGPLGVPRPPTPREVLQFTEEYAIPTLIAVLEANIRALELLAAAIRLAERRPSTETSGDLQQRATDLSRETLDRLDDALADLQSAVEGEPTSPEARRLLAEARELRAEVDERLAAADSAGSEREPGEDTTPVDGTDDETDDAVDVDVESELDAIRDDIDDERRNG